MDMILIWTGTYIISQDNASSLQTLTSVLANGKRNRLVAYVSMEGFSTFSALTLSIVTARSCPDAHSSDFLNGTIKGKAYFYPQIIELNCILGHELLGGESAFQCNQRGIWEEIDKRPTQDLWESAMREQQKELKRANECLGSDEIRTKPNDHRKLNLPNCQRIRKVSAAVVGPVTIN